MAQELSTKTVYQLDDVKALSSGDRFLVSQYDTSVNGWYSRKVGLSALRNDEYQFILNNVSVDIDWILSSSDNEFMRLISDYNNLKTNITNNFQTSSDIYSVLYVKGLILQKSGENNSNISLKIKDKEDKYKVLSEIDMSDYMVHGDDLTIKNYQTDGYHGTTLSVDLDYLSGHYVMYKDANNNRVNSLGDDRLEVTGNYQITSIGFDDNGQLQIRSKDVPPVSISGGGGLIDGVPLEDPETIEITDGNVEKVEFDVKYDCFVVVDLSLAQNTNEARYTDIYVQHKDGANIVRVDTIENMQVFNGIDYSICTSRGYPIKNGSRIIVKQHDENGASINFKWTSGKNSYISFNQIRIEGCIRTDELSAYARNSVLGSNNYTIGSIQHITSIKYDKDTGYQVTCDEIPRVSDKNDGLMTSAQCAKLENLNPPTMEEILESVYPIGSIYITVDSRATCPLASMCPSTKWSVVSEGMCLWGVGQNDTAGTEIAQGLPSLPSGTVAGTITDSGHTHQSKAHTHSDSGHTHTDSGHNHGLLYDNHCLTHGLMDLENNIGRGSTGTLANYVTTGYANISSGNANIQPATVTIESGKAVISHNLGVTFNSSTIYGSTTNVQPAAYRVKMWQRVS